MKKSSADHLPNPIRVMLSEWDVSDNNFLRLNFEKVITTTIENIDAYGFVEVMLSPIQGDYQFLDSFLFDNKVFIKEEDNRFNLINGEFENGYNWESTHFIRFEEIKVTTTNMTKAEWNEVQDHNLSEILKQYCIEFQTAVHPNDAPIFSSSNTLLALLFNVNNTLNKARILYQNIEETAKQAIKEIKLITNIETGSIEICPHLAEAQNVGKATASSISPLPLPSWPLGKK